ncbi:MAG: hypothetical protein ACRDJM_09900 [Actinomycetota bacterium]
MKKLLAMVLMALMVFGLTSAFGEPGGECGAGATAGLPVDVACTDFNGPGADDDEACLIWINGVDPGADGCYNESDAPA